MQTEHQVFAWDDKYFELLGKYLISCCNNIFNVACDGKTTAEIMNKITQILARTHIDDIVRYLSPAVNPEYAMLGKNMMGRNIICDAVSHLNSINTPSIETYLKLYDAGFNMDNLSKLVIKLFTTEAEFLANEKTVLGKYMSDPILSAGGLCNEIKTTIYNSPEFSYEFIRNHLYVKYPQVFSNIHWGKLAVKKGAIEIISKLRLQMSFLEIVQININYCTIKNMDIYNALNFDGKWHTGELFTNILLENFIRVNKLFDCDHSKINYIKYLRHFKMCPETRYDNYYLANHLSKYNPDLVIQFLDHIRINITELALRYKITLDAKVNYIKQRYINYEYQPSDIANFINKIIHTPVYDASGSKTGQLYKFSDIIGPLTDAKIPTPWPELLNIITDDTYSYYDGHLDWPNVRKFMPTSDAGIPYIYLRSYIIYFKAQVSQNNWSPSIQLEYINILEKTNGNPTLVTTITYNTRLSLINLLPDEWLLSIPADLIYSTGLYKHTNFHRIINSPTEQSRKLKLEFAVLLKNEICRITDTKDGTVKKIQDLRFDDKLLPNLGTIICQNYNENLDLLEYFNIPGIADIVFNSLDIHPDTTAYSNLSVDNLLNLITMTSNRAVVFVFQSEIERKLKTAEFEHKLSEFAGLFTDGDRELANSSDNPSNIAKLTNAIMRKPVKYWSDDEYRHACQLKLITPAILVEYKELCQQTQPDTTVEKFNWRLLTIIFGTDENILAYPELPWHTPVYSQADNKWVMLNITLDYLKTHTQLFAPESEIWIKFGCHLPINFIVERPNYKFQWHNIIRRDDLKMTPELWEIVKHKLRSKDLNHQIAKYPIDMIMNNLDMGWDLRRLIELEWRVIPMKYLPRLFNPRYFNKSLLDAVTANGPENIIAARLANLRRNLVLSAIIAESDKLKMRCRAVGYLFGSRPHIEKIMLGFTTQCLLS